MTVQDSLLDRLAQRLGSTANAATIFGAPVARGDVTVIPSHARPTALAAAAGRKAAAKVPAAAAGSRVAPVGYIEMQPGVVRDRPIRDWAVLIPTLAAGVALTVVAAVRTARLLRRGTRRLQQRRPNQTAEERSLSKCCGGHEVLRE